MRKIKLYTIYLIIILILIPKLGLAEFDPETDGPAYRVMEVAGVAGYEETETPTVQKTIANILQTVLSFLGIIFLILIISGGYQWMTAGGNEETISKAKKRIINATIGVAIVILAYSITYFIMWAFYKSSGVI